MDLRFNERFQTACFERSDEKTPLSMATESNPLMDVVVLSPSTRVILDICRREMLRPLRDQILRLSGFEVDSTLSPVDGLQMFWGRHYDLVLIDVDGESAIDGAEEMC